jgi:hypothetical protein
MVLLGEAGRVIRAVVAGVVFMAPVCAAILYVFPS